MRKKLKKNLAIVRASITFAYMSAGNKVTKSVRLTSALGDRATNLAQNTGLSESDVLRMSFEAGIGEVEKLLLRQKNPSLGTTPKAA